jgi:hypothetical protein
MPCGDGTGSWEGAFHSYGEKGHAGTGVLLAARYPRFGRVKRTLAVLAFCIEGGKVRD